MDNPKSLFNNNTKVCENCKRPLPHDYKENLCPRCRQNKIQNVPFRRRGVITPLFF